MGAGFLHGAGGLHEQVRVARIDGALPGDEERPRAHLDAAEGESMPCEPGARIHQLVDGLDAIHPVDIGQA
jgi:hypothetical protein